MAQPASRISFLSSFADFVRQQRDAIGRTWMQLVRESPDVPGAVHISHDALQDHVPGVSNAFFCRDRGSTERPDLATPLGFEPRKRLRLTRSDQLNSAYVLCLSAALHCG
jgi:hypothetical protein